MYEFGNIGIAVVRHFLDDGAAEIGIPQAGGEKHGIDGRIQNAVGLGHLHLVLKIGDGPQTADDDLRVIGAGKIDGAAVKGADGDILAVPDAFLQHFHPFFHGKEGVFIAIDQYADDQNHHRGGKLFEKGVQLAICTDHPENPIQYLPINAGIAVRGGLDRREALKAITINPARICGIDNRVGSIEVGKDADFTAFKGEPFDITEKPVFSVIGGKLVK